MEDARVAAGLVDDCPDRYQNNRNQGDARSCSMKMSHNTILITGGSSGIGYALAAQFLERGNTVLITGRTEERLATVRQSLPGVPHMLAMWVILRRSGGSMQMLPSISRPQYPYQ